MAGRRTHEAWSKYLNAEERELTLEEFTAMEAAHACAHLAQVASFAERTYLLLERINGRLDRAELFLARHDTTYPQSQNTMPDLPALRANGIPE